MKKLIKIKISKNEVETEKLSNSELPRRKRQGIEPGGIKKSSDYLMVLSYLLIYSKTLWLLNAHTATELREFCIRNIERISNIKHKKISIVSDRHKIKGVIKYILYIDEINKNYILKSNNYFQPNVMDLSNSVKQLLQYMIVSIQTRPPYSSKKSEIELLKFIIKQISFGYLMVLNKPVNKTIFIEGENGKNIALNNTKDGIKIKKNEFEWIIEQRASLCLP